MRHTIIFSSIILLIVGCDLFEETKDTPAAINTVSQWPAQCGEFTKHEGITKRDTLDYQAIPLNTELVPSFVASGMWDYSQAFHIGSSTGCGFVDSECEIEISLDKGCEPIRYIGGSFLIYNDSVASMGGDWFAKNKMAAVPTKMVLDIKGDSNEGVMVLMPFGEGDNQIDVDLTPVYQTIEVPLTVAPETFSSILGYTIVDATWVMVKNVHFK